MKSKKILSLALAIVMALSVLSIGAFAAKTTPTAAITVSASKETDIANGETITITVAATATEDYFVGPVSVPVTYDATLFTAANVAGADIFGAGTTEVVANTTEAGKVTVVITPDTAGTPVATNLNGKNVTLFTFELTAIADAGSCDVAVVEDQKTAANTTGKLYMGSFDSADPRTAELTTVGQTLILTDATVNVSIGAAGDPELILTETGEDYGTIIRDDLCTGEYDGCVFGIDTLNGEAIEDYVTTIIGSIEVVPNEESGEYTTGSTILLKDNDDNVVATYVFIYFGDVNGDGAVDAADAGAVEAHDMWLELIEEDTAAFYAAEVNYDGAVDATDAGAIEAHDMWLEMLEDQNVIADGFNMAW